jgi:hypothetical protein
MITEEAFTRVKPEVGYLRIFRCPIYIHAPKEKRMKLDPSAIQREPFDPIDLVDVLQ